LDAFASAVIGVPGKGECRGSKGACAPLDGMNRPSLWLDRALQGRGRRRLMPARTSNAAWRGERGTGECVALSPKGWMWSKPQKSIFTRVSWRLQAVNRGF